MWTDNQSSFISPRLLASTHSACFLKTAPFACLQTQSVHPVPMIPPHPWPALASQDPTVKGRACGQQFLAAEITNHHYFCLCQFSLRVKLLYYK